MKKIRIGNDITLSIPLSGLTSTQVAALDFKVYAVESDKEEASAGVMFLNAHEHHHEHKHMAEMATSISGNNLIAVWKVDDQKLGKYDIVVCAENTSGNKAAGDVVGAIELVKHTEDEADGNNTLINASTTVTLPTITLNFVTVGGSGSAIGSVKPDGGWKKDDLASDVQTSLGKADTALQSVPTATTSAVGGIKVGSDFDIDADGKLSLYKAMAITSFSASPSQAEIGSTVNSVTLSWSINKIAATLTLDGVAVTATSKTDNTSRTTNKTWTLKAVDARGTEVTKTASLTFYHRYYVGVSAKATLDNSDVLAFASQAFATSRAKAATEYDCSGSKYPYFCFPESWGTPSFVVGGLPNSDFVKQTISLTNASGNTTTYSVWRTSGIQTGKLNIQVK